jgi:soluble lytic murein transglycosylase-like protein
MVSGAGGDQARTMLVAGVDVGAAVNALRDMKTGLDELGTAATTAGGALDSVQRAIDTLKVSTTEIENLNNLAAALGRVSTNGTAAKEALAGGIGGSLGPVGGGAVGGGMVGPGGSGAPIGISPTGQPLTVEDRIAQAKAGASMVFTPSFDTRSENSALSHVQDVIRRTHPGAPLSGLSSAGQSMWERIRTANPMAWAAAPLGLMGGGGIDMLHGGMQGAFNAVDPWHALAFGAAGVGAAIFGTRAEGDDYLQGSMNVNGGAGRARGSGYGPFPNLGSINRRGGAGTLYGPFLDPSLPAPSSHLARLEAELQDTSDLTAGESLLAGGRSSSSGAGRLIADIDSALSGLLTPGSGGGGSTASGGGYGSGAGRTGSTTSGGGGSRGPRGPAGTFSHAAMYGLFAMPAYAASSMVLGAGMSAISDMSDEQTALQQNAFAMSGPDGRPLSGPALDAQRVIAGQIGTYAGFGTPDMTRTLGENYRLSRNIQDARTLTVASAQTSLITGQDPATSQDQLAPIYKAFGGGQAGTQAVSHFADILARSYQMYDLSPKNLQEAVSRAIPIASAVGINQGQMTTQDLDLFTAMSATMMQSTDITPNTAQSAMRMFFGNLRSPAKRKALQKVGITGDNLTGMEALQQIAGMEWDAQGNERPGGQERALTAIEALGGPRSGMYAEEFIRYIKEVADNTKKMSDVSTTGAANSYVQQITTQTLAGQMSLLQAQWSKMWSNPNSALSRAAGGVLDVATGATQGLNDLGTLGGVQDALEAVPSLRKASHWAGLNAAQRLGELVSSGPGVVLEDRAKSVAAMESLLQTQLTSPDTSPADRQRLLSVYNTVAADLGKPLMDIKVTGGQPAAAHHQAASHAAGDSVPSNVPQEYRQAVAQAAATAHLSPQIIAAQIQQESGFRANAVSPRGAQGIAQFIPGTAKQYGLQNPFDPIASIQAEGRYMADLMTQYGTPERALSAYNSGKPDAYLDPSFAQGQTSNYVRSIMSHTAPAPLGGASQWWTVKASSDRNQGSAVLPVHSATDPHGKGIYASHPLNHDTDFGMAAGTSVYFGFKGGTFLGSHPYSKGHEWGNEMDFALDAGGFAKAIHLRSMQNLKPGQHVSAGDLIGASGGVPGVDADKAYSSAAHLCWVTDDKGYTQLMDLTTGKARPDLVGTAAANAAPVVNTQAHIAQIMKSSASAQAVMDAAGRAKINPMVELAILRSQGVNYQDTASVKRIASDIGLDTGGHTGNTAADARMLIEREIQGFNPAAGAAGHMNNAQMAAQVRQEMTALQTWGAFQAPPTYSLVPQTTPGPGTIGPGAQPGLNTTNSLLQQLVDGQSQANGYLSRMGNFNVPQGYGIPHFEDWSAATAASQAGQVKSSPSAHAANAGTQGGTSVGIGHALVS